MTHTAAQLWVLLVVGLSGGLLLSAPAEVTDMVRTTLRDPLAPGQWAAVEGTGWVRRTARSVWSQITSSSPSGDVEALRQALAIREREVWQAQIEAAEAWRQLAEERRRAAGDLPVAAVSPLYQADLVTARILGAEVDGLWRSRPVLGLGTTGGVRETALVLDDVREVVDAGHDAALQPDQPVLAGGAVVGKVLRVGRFSSTLCRVTDAEFAGAARLLRRTGRTVQLGAVGTLQGDGSARCRLLRIPASEPVSVGDLVVTVDTEGLLPPQVYGTVVEANPPEGTLEWQISVEPAATAGTTTVQVLRLQLNPLRMVQRTEE